VRPFGVATPFRTTDAGTAAPVAELVAGVGRALGELGDDRRRVAALGIAGVAESGAPFDGQGRPPGTVIDRRGDEVATSRGALRHRRARRPGQLGGHRRSPAEAPAPTLEAVQGRE
jgi:sugar (pentulose or hexulose) kinase